MSTRETEQFAWRLGGQATVTNASATAFDLAYSGTFATGAQNPANRPAEAVKDSRGNYNLATQHSARLHIGSGIRMRFLVADTANDDVACTIWTWDANGAPMNALILNPIRAGTTSCTTHPITGDTLTNFFYAHTITATSDHTDGGSVTTVGTSAANGILELNWDTMGATWLYADFDINLPSGTDGTDGICLFKEYG